MSWFDQAIQKVQLAGQDPRVKYLLDNFENLKTGTIIGAAGLGQLPAIKLPVALDPLKTRVPTTILGKTGKLFNPLNPVNAAATVVGAAARKFLPPADAQRAEYFTFGLTPGIVLNILDAGAVNSNEDKLLQKYKNNFLQEARNDAAQKSNLEAASRARAEAIARANAEAAAVENLGTPTPPPLPGNRVDASTPQMETRQAAPVQSPRIPQFTEASLQAANTGYAAPADVPLSQFYNAQQILGSELEKTGELQRRLRESGGAAGIADAALMAWAQKNPGLAYREMVNRESRATMGPVAD